MIRNVLPTAIMLIGTVISSLGMKAVNEKIQGIITLEANTVKATRAATFAAKAV
jgi:hypothetical protein